MNLTTWAIAIDLETHRDTVAQIIADNIIGYMTHPDDRKVTAATMTNEQIMDALHSDLFTEIDDRTDFLDNVLRSVIDHDPIERMTFVDLVRQKAEALTPPPPESPFTFINPASHNIARQLADLVAMEIPMTLLPTGIGASVIRDLDRRMTRGGMGEHTYSVAGAILRSDHNLTAFIALVRARMEAIKHC